MTGPNAAPWQMTDDELADRHGLEHPDDLEENDEP